MIRVVKKQRASIRHKCDNCPDDILNGEEYLRVVQFLSWDDIGVDPPEPETDDRWLWSLVVRQPNTVILKTHLEGECLS